MKFDIYSEINTAFEKAGWFPTKSLEHFDETCLTEDMAQFEKGNLVIDFGFYGDSTQPEHGEYVIYVIRERNWEKPIARISFKEKRAALAKMTELPLFDFSLSIEIHYEIKILPLGKERYRLLVDTEGSLKLTVNGDVIFTDEGILLVEFASTLHQWITSFSKENPSELFYESMDFEEKPLIQFSPMDDESYEFYSPWQEKPNIRISGDALLQESKKFIGSLYRELQSKVPNIDRYDYSDFLKEYMIT